MPQKSHRAGCAHFLQTRNFLLPAQSFKSVLLPQRKPSGWDSPSVDHLCWATSLSITGALALIVLAKTSLKIRRDATIEGVVSAKQHIHPPGLAMIQDIHAVTLRGEGLAVKAVHASEQQTGRSIWRSPSWGQRHIAVRRGHVSCVRGNRIGTSIERRQPESLGGVPHSVPDDDRYSPENLLHTL
jgi:hypothetical protein